MSLRDIGLALLVVVIWGLNFVAIKWGVGLMPPLFLTGLRYLAAALPAVFFLPRPKVSLRLLVAYGLAVGVLEFGLLFTAIRLGIPAGLSSLVIQMQAFFTIAFAVPLLGERLGPAQLTGAALALCGIVVIGTQWLQSAALLPLVMVLGAAAFWGLANIITKKAGQVDMMSFVAWSSLVPPLPLMVLSLWLEGPAAIGASLGAFSPFLAGIIAFNGYLSTLVGFGLWSVLLRRYPASIVAPFSLLVPVVGLACGALLLDEVLEPLELWGCGLVFFGLLVNVFGARVWALRALRRAGP